MDKVMHIGGFEHYEVLASYPGAFFENMLADHPFLPKTSRLVLADYVTMDSGTGCVHTAPGFGADDYQTCKRTAWTWWCRWTIRASTPPTPASTRA